MESINIQIAINRLECEAGDYGMRIKHDGKILKVYCGPALFDAYAYTAVIFDKPMMMCVCITDGNGASWVAAGDAPIDLGDPNGVLTVKEEGDYLVIVNNDGLDPDVVKIRPGVRCGNEVDLAYAKLTRILRDLLAVQTKVPEFEKLVELLKVFIDEADKYNFEVSSNTDRLRSFPDAVQRLKKDVFAKRLEITLPLLPDYCNDVSGAMLVFTSVLYRFTGRVQSTVLL